MNHKGEVKDEDTNVVVIRTYTIFQVLIPDDV